MNIKDRFLEYADAFEITYEDNDWSRLEPFFTEGAVCPASCSVKVLTALLQ